VRQPTKKQLIANNFERGIAMKKNVKKWSLQETEILTWAKNDDKI
jgi:hypothetical protein